MDGWEGGTEEGIKVFLCESKGFICLFTLQWEDESYFKC